MSFLCISFKRETIDCQNEFTINQRTSKIKEDFTLNKFTELSNNQKIEYKGEINNLSYYLVQFYDHKIYLKTIPEGFCICRNLSELNDLENIYRGDADRMPSNKKIYSAIKNFDYISKTGLSELISGLKISHVYSNYIREDETRTSKHEYSEYVLYYNNKYSILMFHYIKGFSIFNNYS